jgi:hypothetical protein
MLKLKYILYFLLIILFIEFLLISVKINENFNNYENDIYFEHQEIIIARYNEDLSWIDESPFNRHPIIIYNKGDEINIKNENIKKIVNLPNIGRETHTFLYHIIENYDNLSDVTIFLVGSIKLSNKYERSIKMIETVEKTNKTYLSCLVHDKEEIKKEYNFKLDSYRISDENNLKKNNNDKLEPSSIRPFGKWFDAVFVNEEKNNCFVFNSILSVSRKNILQKPKSYYENILNQVNTGENLETVHYVERSWYAIFYPYDDANFNDNKLTENVETLNKTIWILYFQGWENAPFLQKEVAKSWERHNPDWKIQYLDINNLKNFINDIDYIYNTNKNISYQAKSDIVRLSLLKNHGGVWVDSTFLCMESLNNWVYKCIKPSGFWMYHGNGAGMNIKDGPCSWFMISVKGSYIITKWKESCDNFWKINNMTENYFWMDELFKKLFENDNKFKNSWNNVPYISAEEFGSSHSLLNKVFENDDKLKNKFKESSPYGLKFWKGDSKTLEFCELDKNCLNSNGYYALQLSKNNVNPLTV